MGNYFLDRQYEPCRVKYSLAQPVFNQSKSGHLDLDRFWDLVSITVTNNWTI